MSTKRIRLLSVEIHGREPHVYLADKPRPIKIDGVQEFRTITNIIETETCYEIYLSVDEESRHWKDIPKNNSVTVEYYIS